MGKNRGALLSLKDWISGNRSKSFQEKSEDDYVLNKGKKVNLTFAGSSGTENYSGYIQEEEFNQLQHPYEFAIEYDKMERSEPMISAGLHAISSPIENSEWSVYPKDFNEDACATERAKLLESIFKKTINFRKLKYEMTRSLKYGFAVFERAFTYCEIGGAKYVAPLLEPRLQRTIYRWNLGKGDVLETVEQQAYGDYQAHTFIPAEDCIVVSFKKEANNFNGISLLRSLYGSYFRKKEVQVQNTIAYRNFQLGQYIVKSRSALSGLNKQKVLSGIKSFSKGETRVLLTDGHIESFERLATDFSPEKAFKLMEYEDEQIMKGFLLNFLLLTGGGSFALSKDLSDFFLNSLNVWASWLTESLNPLLDEIEFFNFGTKGNFEWKASGINESMGKEMAEVLAMLIDKKVLTPTNQDEELIRKQLKLPKIQEEELPESRKPSEGGQGGFGSFKSFSSGRVYSAKTNRLISSAKDNVLNALRIGLSNFASEAIKKIINGKPVTATSKARIVRIVRKEVELVLKKDMSGLISRHRKDLGESKASSAKTLRQYKDETPDGYYDGVPVYAGESDDFITIAVIGQADKIESQLRQVYERNKDSQAIQYSMEKKAQDSINSGVLSSVSKDVISFSVNSQRKEFMKLIEKSIVSITFNNETPVSKICTALAGKTFPWGHPDIDRYNPPLHDNCDSYYTINTTTTRGNPAVNQEELVSLTKGELESGRYL